MGRNKLCELFKRLINNISHENTWTWLRKGNFERETKFLLIAAQNNAIKAANVGYVVIETKHQSHNKQMQQINMEGV